MTSNASSNQGNQGSLNQFITDATESMEIGSTNPYAPGFAGGKSGLSFGSMQNDVSSQGVLADTSLSAAGVLKQSLTDYLTNNPNSGLTTNNINQIVKLAGTKGITEAALEAPFPNINVADTITAALTSDAALVKAQDQAASQTVQGYVNNFITQSQSFPNGAGVLSQNNLDPTAVAMISAWVNQTGEPVTMLSTLGKSANESSGGLTVANIQTYLQNQKYFKTGGGNFTSWMNRINTAVQHAFAQQPASNGTLSAQPPSTSPVPVACNDGDASNLNDLLGSVGAQDPGEGLEGGEQISNVGGQGVDLRAAGALVDSGGLNLSETSYSPSILFTSLMSAQGLSVTATSGSSVPTGSLAGLSTALDAYGGNAGALSASTYELMVCAQQDPYDPKYSQVYAPITPSVLSLPALPTTISGPLQQDLTASLSAMSAAASYANAVYVTQDRLNSAYNAGDIASFVAQNQALNKYVASLAQQEALVGKTDSAIANDLQSLGVDVKLSQANVSSFQATLDQQGVSSLPDSELALIQTFLPDATLQNSVGTMLSSADTTASTVPGSLINTLQSQASTATTTSSTLTISAATNNSIPTLSNAGPLSGLSAGLNFTVTDTSTNQTVLSGGESYSGPVAGLTNDIIVLSSDNLNLTSNIANVFMKSGSGTDALNVSSSNGNNVLDGSTGSNFMVGGTGNDTFFVDDRGPTSDIWSTVVNFHRGDAATIFGVTPQTFAFSWVDGQGAVGYTGLTLHATATGVPTASVTLPGFTTGDLSNGKLGISFGTTAASNGVAGSTYMYVHAT